MQRLGEEKGDYGVGDVLTLEVREDHGDLVSNKNVSSFFPVHEYVWARFRSVVWFLRRSLAGIVC